MRCGSTRLCRLRSRSATAGGVFVTFAFGNAFGLLRPSVVKLRLLLWRRFAGGERTTTLALHAVGTRPPRGALWRIALGSDTEGGSVTMRAFLGSLLRPRGGALCFPQFWRRRNLYKFCGPLSTTTVGAFVAFAFGIALCMLRPSVGEHLSVPRGWPAEKRVVCCRSRSRFGHHGRGLCHLRLRQRFWLASAVGGGATAYLRRSPCTVFAPMVFLTDMERAWPRTEPTGLHHRQSVGVGSHSTVDPPPQRFASAVCGTIGRRLIGSRRVSHST